MSTQKWFAIPFLSQCAPQRGRFEFLPHLSFRTHPTLRQTMGSQSNSLKRRNTTFPGSDDSQLGNDAAWKSPESPPRTVTEPLPAKRIRPSSASTRYPIKISLAPVLKGSPWETYQKDWCLGLKNSVDVAYKISREGELYTVRNFSESDAEEIVALVHQLHHKNLVPIHEMFTSQEGFFIISPYLDISLEGINGSPRYPNERQLAALSYEVSMPLQILYIIAEYLVAPSWHFIPRIAGLDSWKHQMFEHIIILKGRGQN
jgi:hypothetical protein